MRRRLGGDDSLLRNAGLLALLEERHHGAQLRADFLNRLILRRFTHVEELLPSGAVLGQPRACKFAALDLVQDLFHFLACLFVDDPWPARIVAVLGRIRDGVAHITEAAFINEVNDQLELVQTLEVRYLRRITRFRESLEARANQLADAAA